ncbi:MAG: molybdopterin molybdotransferase MoeA [Oscillospiraceae bacterium]|nr:molybdopterin molybdotransferase MoeA [Oscillospiraceae bacterium]
MLQNVTFQEAAKVLLEHVVPVGTETVPLTEALGRILAQDVFAQTDVPPFDRSPFDGYAFQAADSLTASPENPITLRITEEIPAGSMGTIPVTSGYAAKILTGAPIPPGADTVCKFEDTVFTAETVTLNRVYQTGKNIVLRGEDLTAGDILAQNGQRIDAALCGTLSTQNIASPLVYRRPLAGIITTGSELCDVGTALSGGKIVNSNRYTFTAALQAAGCHTEFFGCPGDTVESIAQCFRSAAETSDLIVTTGGVSVGDYDLTPAALEAAGGTLLIQNMKLKPGGKCCFGMLGSALVCCLSGNPASSMTAFYAAVLPAVRKLCGRADCDHRYFPITLLDDFPKKSPKPRLLRGILSLEEGIAGMHITGEQGNSVLHTMIGCNVLAMVPPGTGPLKKGSTLTAFSPN